MSSALLEKMRTGKRTTRAHSEGPQRFSQTFRFQNWMGISKKRVPNWNPGKQEIGKRRITEVNISQGISITDLFRRKTHPIAAVIL